MSTQPQEEPSRRSKEDGTNYRARSLEVQSMRHVLSNREGDISCTQTLCDVRGGGEGCELVESVLELSPRLMSDEHCVQ
jgi:hypothetical protein